MIKASSKLGNSTRPTDELSRVADRLLHEQADRASVRAAFVLLESAAKRGDDWAAWKLGDSLYHGVRCKKDIPAALVWYGRAARLGNAGAMSNLGYHYWRHDDKRMAVQWYKRAARNGSSDAMHNLGLIVSSSQDRDAVAKGFRLFLQAAKLGHCESQYKVAVSYLNGLGVRVSAEQSLKWFKKAAKCGSPEAREFLAGFKERGR